MSWKKILLLAIILSGMLLYVSKFEIADDVEKAGNDNPFRDLDPQSIESINIKNPQGVITLDNKSPAAKSDNSDEVKDSISDSEIKSWQIHEVDGSELDRAALNAVTAGIRNLNLDSTISKEEAGEDLAPFGLKAPDITVSFKAGGKDFELKLGKMNDFVARRYLQISGRDGIHLVSGDLFGALNKKPSDYRKRTPIELVDGDVKLLTVADQQTTIKLSQDDRNKWKIEAPIQFPASDFAISNITREVRNLRVSEFIDGKDLKPSDYGLDKPVLRVVADFKDSVKRNSLELLVGKKETVKDKQKEIKFYFQVNGKPSIFETSADPTGRVMRPINDLREKKLFKFVTDQADQIDFSGKGSEIFSIKRAEATWKIGERDGDKPFVDQVVKALSELEASSFQDGAQSADYGFTDPTLKVVVHLKTGSSDDGKGSERVLTIGKEVPGGKDNQSYYASVDGLPDPFIITSDTLKKISPHKEALLKSEPEPTAAPSPVSK